MAHDMIGTKWGRFTVLEKETTQAVKGRDWRYLCRCECGTVKYVPGYYLRDGQSTSCGCVFREKAAARLFRHGYYGTSEYRSWHGMKQRCLNPKSHAYRHYGGRGIKICDEWKDDFLAFLSYLGKRPPNMSVDRIDNNGNYEPGNVKWSTRKEQADNQRKNPNRGEKHHNAKLTDEWVIKIRTLKRDTGWGPVRIYRHLNPPVAKSTLKKVIEGAVWKHVQLPCTPV